MGIFLSSSIGFGATMNVDGTVDAGEYHIVSTDSDVGTEQFIFGGGSDIDTVSWGYDPATGFYHIAMKVKGPINTTGDGTMDLDVIRALTPHAAELTTFEGVPVKKGDVFTLTVQPGGVVSPMQAGDRTVPPGFTGTLSPPSLLGG